VPQDEFFKDLQGAWASATTDPKVSKADKVLLQLGVCSLPYHRRDDSYFLVENGVAGAMVKETKGAVIVEGIKTGLEAVGGMEVIKQGLNAFMEGMPVLMNALDEVAKLHPYVSFFGSVIMQPGTDKSSRFIGGVFLLVRSGLVYSSKFSCGHGIQGRVGARAKTSRERPKNTCVACGDEGHDGRSDTVRAIFSSYPPCSLILFLKAKKCQGPRGSSS
jgi:hypothetical protein